jgi:glycosyltransferase involved in cell wall biosynthesis
MHCLVLTRQVGHYHNARFRAAAERFGALTVLSCAGEGYFAEFAANRAEGYAVERLSESHRDYRRLVATGELASRVCEILDFVRPDVVAAAGWASAESYAALAWSRRNRVPTVVMGESQYDDTSRSRLREALKGHIVRMFDAGFAGGPSTRDYFIRLGIAPDRVALGYNAVGNAHFAAGADRARADRQAELERHGLPRRYFLASGRFIEKKNFPGLVRAYAAARADLQDAAPDLVILGDGDARSEIESAVAETGTADHVHLPGYRGYDVLPAYYGLAEGFVHVPVREQWGLVINEAMASGVPVIASTVCGATRAVMADGRNGFVVDPARQDKIAEAIRQLALLSPDRRAAMGAAAASDIADWGPDRFASGLASATTIAEGRQRRRPLSPWDEKFLQLMGRRVIDDVD